MAWESLETQRTAYRRIRSVFGIASVFGIEVHIELGYYLESKFKRSVCGIEVEIEVGLTGKKTKRLVFQLVVDQCSNWDWFFWWPVNRSNNFKSYNTHIHICKQNPQTKCGFHLQFVDSTCNLRIPLTVAESAKAHFNYTNVLLFVCGFHKLFWIPRVRLRILQNLLFSEQFWAIKCFRYLFMESKTA